MGRMQVWRSFKDFTLRCSLYAYGRAILARPYAYKECRVVMFRNYTSAQETMIQVFMIFILDKRILDRSDIKYLFRPINSN